MSDAEQPMAVGGGLSLATTTGFMVAAAALVVFLLFLFVFAVYLHAKRCYGADPVSARGARLVFTEDPAPGGAAAARQCGLGADAIAALPSATFRAAEFEEGVDCAVCLCQLGEGEAARLLPRCGHLFHVACVDMWLRCHSTCPLCRSAVAPGQHKAADSGADSGSSRGAEEMVVEIPIRRAAPDGATAEEEVRSSPRSPTAALRVSLRRMLSRGSRAAAGSSSSPRGRDIEQGCLPAAKTPASSSMHD